MNDIIKQRDPLFDNAKGLGIILLVLGHLFTYGSAPFQLIFAFHMPLFFIISGIFVRGKKIKLLTQYFFPYIFFTVLSLLLIGIPKVVTREGNPLDIILILCKEFVQKFGLDYVYMGNLWFLVILAFGVCIVEALCNLVSKYKIGNIYLLVSLLLISIVFVKIPYRMPFLLKTLPMACFWIAFGKVAGKELAKNVTKISNKLFILLLIVFVGFVALNGCVNIGTPMYNDTSLYIFNALLGVMLIFWCSNHQMPKFIEFIGRNSLYFFASEQLGRVLVLFLINYIFHTNYESMINMPIWLAFLVLIPIILFGYVFYYGLSPFYNKIFEKIKIKIEK